MSTVYAIRERGTGKYLPALKSSGRVRARGFSHTEPIEAAPRFFYTKRSAVNALAAWLQGTWENETSRSGMYGEDVDVYVVPTAVTGRSREKMEIVQFELKEVVNG